MHFDLQIVATLQKDWESRPPHPRGYRPDSAETFIDDAAVAAAQLEVARATENFGAEKDRFIAGNCNSFARVWKALSALLLCHSSVTELHSPSTLIPRGEARRSVIANF